MTSLHSTVSPTLPCELSHAIRVAPSDMVRLSHASQFSVTGLARVPRPSFSFFLISFFLHPPLFTLRRLY
jgi:hypothetical protein